MSNENIIILDALNWKSKEDFYNSYCDITKAPIWFGKNLDALCDSFRGGICKNTPKKLIIRNFTKKIKTNIGLAFWSSLVEICKEEEIELELHSD